MSWFWSFFSWLISDVPGPAEWMSFSLNGEVAMNPVILADNQVVEAHVAGLDAAGNPAQLFGVAWSVLSGTSVGLRQHDNDVTIVASGQLGNSVVQCSATQTSDPTSPVVTATLNVSVVPSDLASLALTPAGPLQVSDNGTVTVTVSGFDAASNGVKNPVSIPSVPTWVSSDPTIVTVTPAADGLSAVLAGTAKLGAATVTVSADDGKGNTITTSLDVTTVSGVVASLVLTVDTPVVPS